MSWNNFNEADDQNEFDIIPKGTLAKVRMTIKPGGFDDASQGWTGGWATQSNSSTSIYLACEFVVLDGKYARRKIWSLIGLHSPKGPDWANMGRAFIKGILNSARGISNKDNSTNAQNARCINGLGDLEGVEFIARVDVEKDQHGNDKNTIKYAVTPDHKEYASLMGQIAATPNTQATATAPASSSNASNLPSWAK